jgi:hypothetical protein
MPNPKPLTPRELTAAQDTADLMYEQGVPHAEIVAHLTADFEIEPELARRIASGELPTQSLAAELARLADLWR